MLCALPQKIATQNVCERVADVKPFYVEFLNVHGKSFLLVKNEFEVQQVGPARGARTPATNCNSK